MPNAGFYHDQGFNCCESVLSALCDFLSIKAETIPRIATGFGGGVGHTGDICGAVTGAVMALGLKHGRDNPGEKEKRDRLYLLVEQLLKDLQKEIGSIQCFDLIGVRMNTEEGMRTYHEQKLGKRCHSIIEQVETIAREYVEKPIP